jgi:hypothetical protein
MNTKEIEALLEKYYSGEASHEEERQLRKFFLEEIVPPHLSADAELFRSFASARKEELPDPDFEKKFLAAIGEPKVMEMFPRKRRLVYITSLAAGILLLAGILLTLRFEVFKKSSANSMSTEEAYIRTKQALMMLSQNFNTGLDQAQKFQAFDKGLSQVGALRSFDKGIQQVQKFSDFYKYQKIVNNPGEK